MLGEVAEAKPRTEGAVPVSSPLPQRLRHRGTFPPTLGPTASLGGPTAGASEVPISLWVTALATRTSVVHVLRWPATPTIPPECMTIRASGHLLVASPPMKRHILVAVAWPYASGSRHLGHLSGAYLPADIFARYHRLAGNDVLMVSGSDVHGTPITVRADQEGVEPQVIVDRYHAEFLANWESLGISWDLYTSTGTDNHRRGRLGRIPTTQRARFHRHEAVEPVLRRGCRTIPAGPVRGGHVPVLWLHERPGRPVRQLRASARPEDLIDPKRRISRCDAGHAAHTEHFFLRLSAFRTASSSGSNRRGVAPARAEHGARLHQGGPARPRDHA